MQNITIAGIIDRKAEEMQKRDGGKFLKFVVVASDGNSTNWYNCLVNERYQATAPYLTEGAKVVVQGQLRAKAYVNDSGDPRPSLTVVTRIGDIEILRFSNDKNTELETPQDKAGQLLAKGF